MQMLIQQIRNRYSSPLLQYLAREYQIATSAYDVFSFTGAAKLTLRIIWLLVRITPSGADLPGVRVPANPPGGKAHDTRL